MRRFVLVGFSMICLLSLSTGVIAQVQYCPSYVNGTGPDCYAQYDSCWADNEGKNCDASTCSAYCEQQFRDCLYGPIVSTYIDYPIGSKTLASGDACYLGCTANYGCSWTDGATEWRYLSGYDKYDTTWAERHTEHH